MRRFLAVLGLALAFVATQASAQLSTYTFGTLPLSPTEGQLAWITDNAGTATVGSPASGGAAPGNRDLVVDDGDFVIFAGAYNNLLDTFGVLYPLIGMAFAFVGVQLAIFGLYMGASFAPNHKGMPILPRGSKVDFLRRQVLTSRNIRSGHVMNHFMGGFFLIFSFFKLLDLQAFAEAYRRYDILARRFPAYGWVYPFLELTLGMGYFSQGYPTILNAATLILMSLSSLGVAQSLLQGKKIECACLGTFFKLPMSQLTLFEDLVMAAMALICLIL